ncbi:hypothetical protein ATW7_03557 [Alteromonadales bacterium TW-7]|nr:hypothetical protein ATW7_03557 [Alteromonadales bacterium TW-7]
MGNKGAFSQTYLFFLLPASPIKMEGVFANLFIVNMNFNG